MAYRRGRAEGFRPGLAVVCRLAQVEACPLDPEAAYRPVQVVAYRLAQVADSRPAQGVDAPQGRAVGAHPIRLLGYGCRVTANSTGMGKSRARI